MHVGIEALGINREGGGRVATMNLLRPLLALGDDHTYTIWLSEPEPSLEGLRERARQVIVPTRNRFAARIALQRSLPRFCREEGIDVVHFVKNQVVPHTGCRTVATVYDLTTLRHPEAYPLIDVWYWRYVLPRQYRRLDAVIAISESTAADLNAFYGLPRERIRVIPCAYDPAYRPVDHTEVARVRARYGLGDEPYFIHVGNLSKKKNLAVLLEAFLAFRARSGFAGRMVFVGGEYPKGRDEAFFARLAQADARESALLTGAVPQEDLIALYAGATAFMFPSLHEGFGLVVLEAMACGVPVAAHAAGAVRDVVGDAGIVIESPGDLGTWRDTFERLASDAPLREQLRNAGLARAATFSPERTARQTRACYEALADRQKRHP